MPIDDLLSSYNRFRAREDASYDLFRHRIGEILLVSSFYDAFVFEQDGVLSEMLIGHYGELNLSSPPRVTNAVTGIDALRMMKSRPFDMVIVTMRVGEMTPFDVASRIRESHPGIPILLLLSSPQDLRLVEARRDRVKDIDDIFMWTGDSSVFLAMIKSVEDRLNLAEDTRNGLVRVILVVEDSVPHYSTFLPVLYQALVRQTQQLLSEELTEANRRLRMRMRPKVILVHDFASAERIHRDYREYLSCVITDVEFERAGRLDEEAGLRFVELLRSDNQTLPVLLQSMDPGNATMAFRLGARFVHKKSPHLRSELRDFIVAELGYGDFVFRAEGGEELARAASMLDLIQLLRTVPDSTIVYHARNDHFSGWLVAHNEVLAARRIRPVKVADFPDTSGLRQFLIDAFVGVRKDKLDGRIVDAGAWEGLNRSQVVRLREGSLGGKGRGLAFLNSLLHAMDLRNVVPGVKVTLPVTAVVGTAEFDEFLERNLLTRDLIRLTDDEIRAAFLAGSLSDELTERLRRFVERVHTPLAVRSSSLLEDSQACPLAGVYHTFMIPNRDSGTAARFDDLATAIKLVFASVFERQSREYLDGAGYSIEDEKMAVVIQEIVGRAHGRYLYPDLSGVAQSYNFYPSGPARPQDGVASVALGLGKAVMEGRRVMRFCPRFPDHDLMSTEDILRGSQRDFWAIDMDSPPGAIRAGEEGTLARLDLAEAERHGTLGHVASVWDRDNDRMVDGLAIAGPRVVTFANILRYRQFPLAQLLEHLLAIGERALGMPVEVEFAALVTGGTGRESMPTFFPLQIRPLNVDLCDVEVSVESPPRDGDVLLYTDEALGNGVVEGVMDIVYVDAGAFKPTETVAIRDEVAVLNRKLREEGRPYLLIGPGRWGSRDRFLGIPVAWSDISEARVIVEVDLPDFQVESSQGSHFFHNLIARRVGYLKVRHDSATSWMDWGNLARKEVVERTTHCVHARAQTSCIVRMDGRNGRAEIRKCRSGNVQEV
jgi:CheY-like chemotaxis protein